MGKASRDKGAEYERRWARCLRENGFADAERGRDNGFHSRDRAAQDQYDTKGVEGIWFDVKAGYDQPPASPERELQWLIAVTIDAAREGKIGVLIRNRRGKADPQDWWAHLLGDTLLELGCQVYGLSGSIWGAGTPPVGAIRMRAGDLIILLRAAGYGAPLPEAYAPRLDPV